MKKLMRSTMLAMSFLLVFSIVWAEGTQETKDDVVEIEFMQWWDPELPKGFLPGLIEEFEEENPGIKVELISLPYSEVMDQVMIQGAAGTLPDVVGIEPKWISELIGFEVLEKLSPFVERDGINEDRLAVKKIAGETWTFPATTFLYPLYYNKTLFANAGLQGPPKTYEEFIEYAEILTDEKKGVYGWVEHLDLSIPNGFSTMALPFVYAGGGDILDENGRPDIVNDLVIGALDRQKYLFENGYTSPGALSKKESQKVEEFANERIAMMISSIAHINLLRERNPQLDFQLAKVPGPKNYDGPYYNRIASWDIGMSGNLSGKKQEAAWELIKFITRVDVNTRIADNAKAFPGNKDSQPEFITGDPVQEKAYSIFTETAGVKYPFIGFPKAVQSERILIENIHDMLENDVPAKKVLEDTEKAWLEYF